jgi:hypothetical protein
MYDGTMTTTWRVLFLVLGMTEAGTALGRTDAGVPAWLQPPPTAVSRPEEGYRLRPAANGYVYEASTFKAKVGRDGVVVFADKKASLKLNLSPQPTPAGTPTLEGTLRDRLGRRKRPAAPPAPAPPVPMITREDIMEENTKRESICSRGRDCYVPPVGEGAGAGGSFDLTDEIMRGLGQDPYRVEKARFLAATFELRMQLAVEAQKSAVAAALDQRPAIIEALWLDDRYTARERRRILFELWRESDQGADGARARALIEAFVRKRLACGSPDAYSDGELQGFHASAADFAPYGAGCPPKRK